MSLDLKPVQVRLSEEAYEALRMIADANGQDLGEVARELRAVVFGRTVRWNDRRGGLPASPRRVRRRRQR